jgi:hypothetical protein
VGARQPQRVGGGRCARGPVWDGMKCKERGAEWEDMESGEGVEWEGQRIRWGSGILGLIEHADRRA